MADDKTLTVKKREDGTDKLYLYHDGPGYDEINLSRDPKDSNVYIFLSKDDMGEEPAIILGFYGPTEEDVDIDYEWDQWSDPSPSDFHGGRLDSQYYAIINSAKLDFRPEDLEYTIALEEEDPDSWGMKWIPITEEKACEHLGIDKADFNRAVKEARDMAIEAFKEFTSDLSNWEDWQPTY